MRPALVRWLALAVFVLAGCGGGTSIEPASTAPSTSAPPGATTTTSPTTSTPAQPAGPPTAPPEVAATAGGIADQLAEAEAAIRDPSTPEDEVAAQAHLQQVAYRILAERPDLIAETIAALPEELREDAVRQVNARQEFLGMHTNLQGGPPQWRIVAPAPAEDLLAYYREAEEQFGVDWEVLAAVNLVETGLGRIRGVSSAGAQGPMQFLPTTWERWGEGGDIEDPHDAILAAGRYLGASGAAAGDLDAALFEYNNHANYVRGVTRYAEIMRGDPDTFRGFYHWQIYYLTTGGDLLLPEGYPDVPAAPL